MSALPTFCPYCRSTSLHVRVSTWALVQRGDLVCFEEELGIEPLDTDPNARCAACEREFVIRPRKAR